MCDRYVLSDQVAAEREFLPAKAWWKFTAKFNVAARQFVLQGLFVERSRFDLVRHDAGLREQRFAPGAFARQNQQRRRGAI